MGIESSFLNYSADKLSQCAGRIASCLDQLSEEQVWARGTDNENAIGNLVLHLAGNVGLWIGTAIAGRPNTRDRDAEFAARGGVAPAKLKQHFLTAVDECVETIRGLPPQRLEERITVQGYNVTVLEGIYHVVEHFSGHTGQIIFATKLLAGRDLGFYQHLKALNHTETVP